jgi:hypothetical protein
VDADVSPTEHSLVELEYNLVTDCGLHLLAASLV